MKHRRILPILAATLALPALPAAAQSLRYELLPESSYVQGCYPPCKCPLVLAESLGGTFTLTWVGSTPALYERYELSDIEWTIVLGGSPIQVTGSGEYEVGGQLLVEQRLELELSFDGAPPAHFDSGLVPGGGGFPALDVVVSESGMVCFDRVFDLRARPRLFGSSYCDALPNSTGLAAAIGATGSAVVAEDELVLFAERAVPGRFGLFFFGPGTAQLPFGEGLLCVSGALRRLAPPVQANAVGGASRAVELDRPPAAGLLLPGTTWNFQYWYRDPAGGPAGFNLTDGLSLTFL